MNELFPAPSPAAAWSVHVSGSKVVRFLLTRYNRTCTRSGLDLQSYSTNLMKGTCTPL